MVGLWVARKRPWCLTSAASVGVGGGWVGGTAVGGGVAGKAAVLAASGWAVGETAVTTASGAAMQAVMSKTRAVSQTLTAGRDGHKSARGFRNFGKSIAVHCWRW